MSFDPAKYLFNLQHFGVKLGLERMQHLVDILGHPESKFPSIHVTGTNGKGSTCAMINSVLQSAGYKVGLYTSPHLVSFTERIQINGKNIPEKELLDLTLEIKGKLDENEVDNITFFEFTTAIALLHFARERVDIAVIEVGLGGRLDATNIVKPLVSVITNIDLDHTKVLGNNLIDIAKEKAGIIKENVPLVTGEVNPEILSLFEEICESKKTQMFKTTRDFKLLNSDLSGQSFEIVNCDEIKYELAMLGEHQIKNALGVIKTVEILNEKKLIVSDEALRQGLFEAKWPGRLQIYSDNPQVILDGAHNAAGMKELDQFLSKNQKELFTNRKSIGIVGISTGKDVNWMFKQLSKYFDSVIITEASHRAISKEELIDVAKKYFETAQLCEISKTINLAKSIVGSEGLVMVTGSLYVVGDVMKSLEISEKKKSDDLKLSGAKF